MGPPLHKIADYIPLKRSSLLPLSGKSEEDNLAILWTIWKWIWIFGESSWIPLFEQRFIFEKAMKRIWEMWRIMLGKKRPCFSGKQKSLSVVRQKPLARAWTISKIWGWVSTSLLHRPTYRRSIVKVYVFSDSVHCLVTILLDFGSGKFNCIRTAIVSKIWTNCLGIRVEDFLWIHYSEKSSIRFNIWGENHWVNQRTSQVRRFFRGHWCFLRAWDRRIAKQNPKHWVVSPSGYFRQSAQYLRINSVCVNLDRNMKSDWVHDSWWSSVVFSWWWAVGYRHVMRERQIAAQIVFFFQLVRAQVHLHIWTHLHWYSLFSVSRLEGIPESYSFHMVA